MDQILALIGTCLPCFPGLTTPHVSINNKKYKIIKLLGEGGFSYVYLVSDSNKSLYALKRIRCPFGSNDEAYKNAIKEIKNCHRFSNSKTPYIIQSIDEAIVEETDGSRTIYILLPYFEKSLQDIINFNVLENKTIEEAEILRIFIGICRGLQVMHKHKRTGRNTVQSNELEEEADLLLPGDGDEEDGIGGMGALGGMGGLGSSGVEMEEMVPFAHRDIKPANVMLSAEGAPVLVDLGSCTKARLSIKNRQQALTLTDFALEHCTLPYRPPELLDVETNSEITEKTDIWSLGCLLYACCFGYSPFEKLEIEQGANLTVAISSGKYIIPTGRKGYSEDLMKVIDSCLRMDSTTRPTVDEVLDTALEISRKL